MLAVTDPDGSRVRPPGAPLRGGPPARHARRGGSRRGRGGAISGARSRSGVVFLACAALFAWKRSARAARLLFLVSVLYLPALLGLMVFDR